MSNDLKIGLIGIVSIAAFLALVNFIRKANLFDTDQNVYAVFSSAKGIDINNRVLMKGLQIGTVTNIEPADKNITGVKVTLELYKGLQIPANSVASVSTGGPLAAGAIIIEKGDAQTYLASGDVIKTKSDEMADNLQAQIQPLEQKISTIADSLSKALYQYNTKLDTKSQAHIRNRIAQLNLQMAAYSANLQAMNQKTMSTLNNLSQTTAAYARNKEINNQLKNAGEKTNRLAQLNFQRKMDSINRQINQIRASIAGITDGKLGAMVENRDLYHSFNEQLLQTEIMLDDIRVNPKRYIDYSVFGKTSKAPELTMPEAAKQRAQRNIEFNRRQQEQYKNK